MRVSGFPWWMFYSATADRDTDPFINLFLKEQVFLSHFLDSFVK